MAAGMEAQHHLGARGTFDPEALGTRPSEPTLSAQPSWVSASGFLVKKMA